MFKKLKIALVFALCISGVVTTTPAVKAASNTYYVSKVGDNSNSGTKDSPFKTIEQASSVVAAGDTVYLRGGTYYETIAPITDGTSTDPITYKAYENETVTISGSDPVTGWTLDSGSIYKAPMNWDLEGGNQVFVNGEMMRLAQNTTWTTDLDLFDVGWATMQSGTATSITDTRLNKPNNYWKGATVIVKGWWSTQSAKVTSSQGSTIYFDKLPWSDQYTNPAAGGKYFIAGVKGELDRQKEWYFDAPTETLYLWASDGIDPNTLTVEAKKRKYAVDLTGRSYINIEGINIIGASITTENANNNMIKGINAQYLSHTIDLQKAYSYDDTGIDLSGNYNTIRDSEIKYSSGNGVVIRGTNNNVINNFIHETDYMGTYNASVSLAGGKKHLISYNTLKNTGRTIIGGEKFSESIIEYNDISGTGKLSYDLGGVYFARVDGGNTEIRNNWVHNMDSQSCTSCELGIYLDSNTHGFLVHHNTVWNASVSYYIGGRADHNFIYNNQSKPQIEVLSTDYKYNDEVSYNISEGGVEFRWNAQPGIHAYVEGNVKEGYDQTRFGIAGHNFENPPYPVFTPTRHEYSNRALNYGFEADVDGWELTGNKDVKYNFAPMLNLGDLKATTRTADGSALFGPGQNGIEQKVSGLEPNTTYEFSGWAKVAAGEQVSMGVKEFGEDDLYEVVTNTNNGWKNVMLQFTTGESSTSATIYMSKNSTGAGAVYGDDIGLRKVRPAKLPDLNLIPQSQMTATASTEETVGEDNRASYAIDGNPNTFWHASWDKVVVGKLPQSITLELGGTYNINKLAYLPRQDQMSSRITKYNVYVSTDGTNFMKVTSGDWDSNTAEKFAVLEPISAKYIKLEAIEAYNGWTSAAEINVFKFDPSINDAATDKAALEIEYAVGDDATSVTQDVSLPTVGELDSEIMWTSSDISVVATNGKVTRPAHNRGDAIVTLTAKITNGRFTEAKWFTLTVKAESMEPNTDAEDVATDKAALEIGYAVGDHAASVTQNVSLPTVGELDSDIIWESSAASVIDANGKVTRPANDEDDVSVTLTATITKGEASATKSFDVKVKAKAAPVNPEQPSSGQGTDPNPKSKPKITDTGVTLDEALVNVIDVAEDGKVTKKVSIKPEVLMNAFDLLDSNNKDAQTVTIVLNGTAAASKIEISAGVLEKAAKIAPNASIMIKGEQVYYRLPVTLLDISSLAQQLGVKVDEMIISLNIEQVTGAVGQKLNEAVQQAGLSQLGQAFDFNIVAEANGKKVVVNNFGNQYVERVIIVPQAVNGFEATVILYNPETNEMSFVPALFNPQNGKTKVTIKRNGNSMYTIVSFKKIFADVNGHWAQQEIELLASKLILRGVSDISFAPESQITRAEFTAMLVRSLGLTPVQINASFSDVSGAEWYAESIGAAVNGKLIEGFEDGTFRPMDRITREQMAVMIAKAIKATGKLIDVDDLDEEILSEFVDQASIHVWARSAVAQSVYAGIISGKSEKNLDPASDASRAEVAVMLKRLLQYVHFIN